MFGRTLVSLLTAGCGWTAIAEPACSAGSLSDRCTASALSAPQATELARAELAQPLPADREASVAEQASAQLVVEPALGPKSPLLSCGLANPMPGGFTAGYAADTGLDIAGMGLSVFAIAAGHVDYAESGHTLWTGPGDTDRAIRIELDRPIAFGDHTVTHVWYAHMNELAFEQAAGEPRRRHVEAGEYLGTNGKANGMWHLHLGLLLDGETAQRWGSFLLEDEVRSVLCGLRAKQRLPPLAPAQKPAYKPRAS